MRVCIIYLTLFILGMSCFQAYGGDNSTLVYYVVLTMEPSALITDVTDELSSFVLDGLPHNVIVSEIALTTKCDAAALCSCLDGHVWSNEVCEKSDCCNPTTECSLPNDVDPICHPTTRVTIYGSIFMNNEIYFHSLEDPNTPMFKELAKKLIDKMKPVYNTLPQFDGIQVTGFRLGVYASFEVYVNTRMNTKTLGQKTAEAAKALNNSIKVETEGLVDISGPPQPVKLNSMVNIICKMSQNDMADKEWIQEAIPEGISQITNGTESIVSHGNGTTKLTLKQTSEIWAGLINCTFRPELDTGVKILHRASFKLDVALLPQIIIFSDPQFPQCKKGSTRVFVRVKCEIKNSTETYAVDWIVKGNSSALVPGQNAEGQDPRSYDAQTAFSCLPKDEDKPANMRCVFSNRMNQTNERSIEIHVIEENGKHCQAGEGWPVAKADFTAELRCEGAREGSRSRKCDITGKWEKEESTCVNRDLFSIAERTQVIDKGLGPLSQNAAKLFSRLTTATNNTESINSVSNLNTSINILNKMQNLSTWFDESTLEDIVKSSSNILNVPSPDVWTPKSLNTKNTQNNLLIAELYLASVEQLIGQTNTSEDHTSEASNVQIKACELAHCRKTLFGVNVSVDGQQGVVKAAGFKNLAEFLPHIPNTDPNSIVVTMSGDGKKDLSSEEVLIQFKLINPRKRHHEIKCAAMDGNGKWSLDRCIWGGSRDEGSCKCKFSSSFTLFLSRKAVKLPALQEITCVGLAISIASLVLFLMIECLVWKAVTKSVGLYLRHITLVNISVSLLIGNCSLFASAFPGGLSNLWCQICVVLEHFFFLSQFCWMFCLSSLLLYQTTVVWSDLSKSWSQGMCYSVGYGAPFLIVAFTFVSNDGGAEGKYYDAHSCWLTHHSMLKGSFYSFIIPVGIIVFFNLFSMALVIFKLLNPVKGLGPGGHKSCSGGHAAVRILRSIIILTPVFGVTWVLGFANLVLDLADGLAASAVYYIFSVCNSFQGLFILLTASVGERMVRNALRKLFFANRQPSSTKETSMTMQSSSEG